MTSIIKVNEIQDAGGNTILSSNGTGTFTSNLNTPAFQAELTSTQSVSNASATKLQFNNEVFDTNNCYDNSTNYRFTPTVAGKYFVYAFFAWNSTTDFDDASIQIYKNGSGIALSIIRNSFYETRLLTKIVEFNGTTDYVEVYGYQASGGSLDVRSSANTNTFGAYRIGA